MSYLFQFGKYKVRLATESDAPLIAAWIAADPDHRAKGMEPEFFYEFEAGVGCYALCDEEGPVYFWRTSNVVRLDAQFGPAQSEADRARNRNALVDGMDWLATMCAARGAVEILFDSAAPLLRSLAIHVMGCDALPGELVRSLAPERSHVTLMKQWGIAPQQAQQGKG